LAASTIVFHWLCPNAGEEIHRVVSKAKRPAAKYNGPRKIIDPLLPFFPKTPHPNKRRQIPVGLSPTVAPTIKSESAAISASHPQFVNVSVSRQKPPGAARYSLENSGLFRQDHCKIPA
jgi:hypothetical protein